MVRASPPESHPLPQPHIAALTAGGFTRAGAWRRDDTTRWIRFDGAEPLPETPGVYAFAVGGVVHYVGVAQRGLRQRLRRYEIPKTPQTSRPVHKGILTLLKDGAEVDIFIFNFICAPPPLTLNGVLPIDTLAGLEQGLIRAWRPVWNRHGLGAKQ